MEMSQDGRAKPGFANDKFDSVNSDYSWENNRTTASYQELRSSGCDTAGNRCYRLAGVCLGILCVLLLIAVTVMCARAQVYPTSQTCYSTERRATLNAPLPEHGVEAV
ncbi:hypothetical protein MHYP_G00248940 [Metynnis hypsauchen]